MPQAILLQDVETLGERGTVVDVSKGYLRNFLIPRKLAEPATKGVDRRRQAPRGGRRARRRRRRRQRAEESAELLNKTVLTIPHQAGDDGRLFGSVTVAGHRRRDQGGPRHQHRPPQGPPRRADQARSARAWSSVEVGDGRHRAPSRPWWSSRSSRARTLDRRHDRRHAASAAPSSRRRADQAAARTASGIGRRLADTGRADLTSPRPTSGRPRPPDRGHCDSPDGDGHAGHDRRLPAGRAPPQNLEAEQSVLGAVLLSDTALPALIIDERLQPGGLLPRGHGVIFAAMLDLHALGEPVDALTLVEHLKQAGELDAVGGRAAVDLLAGSRARRRQRRASTRAIVRENAMLRRLLRASYEIQAQVHSPRGAARATSSTWPSARSSRSPTRTRRKDFRSIDDLLDAELDKLEKLSREGKAITGTAVGLRGPRHDHRRLPAGQPDHPRRAPVDGQVGAHGQLRRERRARRPARPSRCSRSRCPSASSRSASSPRRRRSRATTCARARSPQTRWPKILQASNRLAAVAAVHRRLVGPVGARRAREGAPARPAARRRPRADPHRLPAADARRRPTSTTASSRSGRSRAASRRSRASSRCR